MRVKNIPKISPGFWGDRLETNSAAAIFHQWEQLATSGCIDNFRIASGEKEGFREGWFFADSDAYKWLDAAAWVYRQAPNDQLFALMDNFIALLGRTQEPDGYLFSYNQIFFPRQRWFNLQIEHELYCHGHLIEAGVSHYEATGQTKALDIARRAADRIVADFRGKGPAFTPGHEEIEIALLRLYEVTESHPYLELARQFIEQRGRNPFFGLSILGQVASMGRRSKFVRQKKQEYLAAHPEHAAFKLPPDNAAKKPANSMLRWFWNALTGKFNQQHAPVSRQTVPVGHSVRFAYLETATAMLIRKTGNPTLLPVLEHAWEHMVTRRMYATGGIGSLPGLEGFGNDYELDPEYAYAETCAALGSIFWNREMASITKNARYSDLLEWQLYNAAAVGLGLDGKTYLFNNPLTCRGGVTRQAWYSVPCCPSNLSRTWADLGKYIYSEGDDQIWVNQYISNQYINEQSLKIEIQSELPWGGKVEIRVYPSMLKMFTLHLRNPSWSGTRGVKVNGESIPAPATVPPVSLTASGFDPRLSRWISIQRTWLPGDLVELDLELSIQLRLQHKKIPGCGGMAAISRGPIVYCLESVDNPGLDIFDVNPDPASLTPIHKINLLGGVTILQGNTREGSPLTFIPYLVWGNRGESQMTVFARP